MKGNNIETKKNLYQTNRKNKITTKMHLWDSQQMPFKKFTFRRLTRWKENNKWKDSAFVNKHMIYIMTLNYRGHAGTHRSQFSQILEIYYLYFVCVSVFVSIAFALHCFSLKWHLKYRSFMKWFRIKYYSKKKTNTSIPLNFIKQYQ